MPPCSSIKPVLFTFGLQVVPVWVNFSFPVVVVVGTGASPPLLKLAGFNDSANGSSSTVLAEYVEGSGTSQLLFEYTVSLSPPLSCGLVRIFIGAFL